MKKYALCVISAAIITYVAAVLIVGWGRYTRGNQVAGQGRELLAILNEYKRINGVYPNQEWFAALGEVRYTVEDRIWTYMHPPIMTDRGELLLMTPIDYRPRYAFGFKNGSVLLWDARSIMFSTQMERIDDKNKGEQDNSSNGGQRPNLNSGFPPHRGWRRR